MAARGWPEVTHRHFLRNSGDSASLRTRGRGPAARVRVRWAPSSFLVSRGVPRAAPESCEARTLAVVLGKAPRGAVVKSVCPVSPPPGRPALSSRQQCLLNAGCK
ncbi:hypothetical protein NN561_006505 [Cricetulus griseus]